MNDGNGESSPLDECYRAIGSASYHTATGFDSGDDVTETRSDVADDPSVSVAVTDDGGSDEPDEVSLPSAFEEHSERSAGATFTSDESGCAT